MKRTPIAPNPVHLAGTARPCAFGAGYAWRSVAVWLQANKQDRTMTTPARLPWEIPT